MVSLWLFLLPVLFSALKEEVRAEGDKETIPNWFKFKTLKLVKTHLESSNDTGSDLNHRVESPRKEYNFQRVKNFRPKVSSPVLRQGDVIALKNDQVALADLLRKELSVLKPINNIVVLGDKGKSKNGTAECKEECEDEAYDWYSYFFGDDNCKFKCNITILQEETVETAKTEATNAGASNGGRTTLSKVSSPAMESSTDSVSASKSTLESSSKEVSSTTTVVTSTVSTTA